MSRRRSSPVLIGRDAELAAAADDLERALGGRVAIVLVGGEAGIGKTRLAEEVATAAESRGFRVARGASYPLATGSLPYGPFSDVLRGLVGALDEAELAAALGGDAALLASVAPALAAGAAPRRPGRLRAVGASRALLLEAFRCLMDRLAAARPLLLLVEDLQWADPESLDVLGYLARSLRDARVVMLLTFRSDEPIGRSSLGAWLAEVERGAPVDRIELSRLDREGTAELVRSLLGSIPAPSFVDLVHERSDGNPFFIEELLESTIDAPDAHLSPSLREVLEERLRDLPAGTWSVLGPLAVARRGLDDRLLTVIAGIPEHDLDDGVRAALDHGLLTAEHDGAGTWYRLRHALIGEVVLDALLAHDRRRLERALAEALEERLDAGLGPGHEGPSWAEVAFHWDAAGETARAVPAWWRAGEEAERRFALGAAKQAFERVLAGWDALADPEAAIGQQRLDILDRAAWDAFLAGDSDADIRLRRLAVAEAERSGHAEAAAVAWADLAFSLWSGDAPEEAERAFQAAESRLPALSGATAARAHVLAVLAQLLLVSGRHRRSLALCGEAIEIAGRLGLRQVEANVRNTRGINLAYLGRCAEAADWLESARTLALEIGDPEETSRAYLNETEALRVCGQGRRALDLVAEGVEACRRMGTSVSYGQALCLHGAIAAYEIGEWDTARRYADLGQEDLQGPSLELYSEAHVLELMVATGDWTTAERRLRQMAGSIRSYPVELQYTGPFATSEAELRLWRGEPREALRAVEAGLDRLERADAALYRVRLLRLGMRAAADLSETARSRHDQGGRAVAVEIAGRLRERVLPAVREVEAMAGGARRLAEADLLTAAAEEARVQGRVEPAAWRAAADAWGALERPYLRAYARWRETEDWLRSGDRAAARDALLEASAIAARLGAMPLARELSALGRRSRLGSGTSGRQVAAHPPAAAGGIESDAAAAAFALTPREAEVLELLIEGRTDRQIADALFISPHTVGIHVSRILGKLGVASRTEAASVAYRLRQPG